VLACLCQLLFSPLTSSIEEIEVVGFVFIGLVALNILLNVTVLLALAIQALHSLAKVNKRIAYLRSLEVAQSE